MNITVRLGEPIWRSVDARRLRLAFLDETLTVAALLDHLMTSYPDFEAAFRGDELGFVMPYQIFVNARIVPPGEEATRRLVDGDTVHLFLPAVGGQDLLPAAFFDRPTLSAARALLGQRLVRLLDGQRLSGRIAEVEAYIGEDDRASHAACGPTRRNAPMYGPPGRAYVYLIYGVHHCLNVVTERAGFPAAILIRAIEVDEGAEIVAARRMGQPPARWTDGPGKVCQALAIDRSFDGHDLCAGVDLWLEAGAAAPAGQVLATPRIGVRGDERALAARWRFVVSSAPGT